MGTNAKTGIQPRVWNLKLMDPLHESVALTFYVVSLGVEL